MKGNIQKNLSLFLFVVFFTLSGCSKEAQHIVEIPWALSGKWMTIDTHTHTRFSDGNLTVEKLVYKALEHGCDAVAITDHSDVSERAATQAYFDEINLARKKYPEIIVLSGIEWNIPPYEGREHVNLLLSPPLEQKLLPEFKKLFEESEDALHGLKWLEDHGLRNTEVALFYNHPSRKDDSAVENHEDMNLWHGASKNMLGFEAGPGHQNQSEPGTYKGRFTTIDRWDPIITQIGGTWDKLLGEGNNIWAALATSDFHNYNMDYYPCEFSRTHIFVPENTAEGVLQALHAGSFWADHGQLLEKFDFFAYTKGLQFPATPGEIITANSDGIIDVYAEVEFSASLDSSNIEAELISNCRSGTTESVKIIPLDVNKKRASWKLQEPVAGIDGKSCYVRSRIRKKIPDGPDLLAYSNPIRIEL